MSVATNTDLTEEDAADLQFPKEYATSLVTERTLYNSSVNFKCINCSNNLTVSYILCDECDVNICTVCFASGAEFKNHKNDHNYRVLNDNFNLFENSDWTAKEELTLLNSLITWSNFSIASKELPNRTLNDIKEHYDYFYLLRHGSKLLPEFTKSPEAGYPEPVIPYRFRLSNVQDPPRNSANSTSYHSLAGYNAARSDFELEYDANAEDLICNLKLPEPDDPYYDIITKLQCSIIKSYNNRLRERLRRKCIIRNHGLIMPRKVTAWLRRYETTITQNVYERLIRFMQIYSAEGFEYLMEGLHRAGELKIKIARLCDFRKKGITTLEGANLYLNLKTTHEEQLRDIKNFQTNSQFKWRNKNVPQMIPIKKRSVYTPLDIVGMPGYEKLNLKEKELCRNIRLVPISYTELKDTLVQENAKTGSLKLLTARRLLKIDVNKTRRLYDFLIQEGYINKPNK